MCSRTVLFSYCLCLSLPASICVACGDNAADSDGSPLDRGERDGGALDGGAVDVRGADAVRQDGHSGDGGGSAACWLDWSAPVVLSEEESEMVLLPGIGYAVSVQGRQVHTVWMSGQRDHGNSEIYYRRSDDAAKTWGTPKPLTSGAKGPASPVIAASGDAVHVVWRDIIDSAEGAIYAKSSTDFGNTWGRTDLLSTAGVRSAAPWVAVRGEAVFVAFEHYDLGPGNTRIRRSRDRGATWDLPIDATREAVAKGGGGCPSLTTGPGERLDLIHCSLKDAVEAPLYNWELYHRISTDNGSTWTEPPVRLTDDRRGDSRFPTSARTGRSLHVVWWDDRDDTKYPHQGYPPVDPEADHNFEVYYKRSIDDGASWEPDVRLTTAEGVARSPAVTASGQRVYVVWQDNRDGNEEIYFKCSTDDGASFGEDTRLTTSHGSSSSPSMAVDAEGNAYLVWTERRSQQAEVVLSKGSLRAP